MEDSSNFKNFSILFRSKKYFEVIHSFEKSQDIYLCKYESLFYYSHSLLNVNENKKASKCFNVVVERFPEKYQGYEGLYLIAEKNNQLNIAETILSELILNYPENIGLHLKYALLMVKKGGFEKSRETFENFLGKLNESELILACYANQAQIAKDWNLSNKLLSKLIQSYPLNYSYNYKYGKNLQKLHGVFAMKTYFENKVETNSFSYILTKGYIESLLIYRDWSKVLINVENVVENGAPPQVAEILFLARMAYINLKKSDVLEELINNFLSVYKDFYFAWKIYALLPHLLYDGNIKKVEQAYERAKETTNQFPENLDAKIMLVTRCTDLYRFKEAEIILESLMKDNQDNFIVFKKWVLLPFYENNYDVFNERVELYKKKFPRKLRDLKEHIFVSLLASGHKEKFLKIYLEQVRGSFFQLVVENPVNWLDFERQKINQIFIKKTKINIQDVKNNIKSKIDYLPKPNDENISLYINHSARNRTLVVCFSGMDGKRTAEHFNDRKLKDLNKITNYSQGEFDYHGFAKGKKDYNFLLLKDLYNCWYQIHTQNYIELIEKIYMEGKYNKLVCVGTSAGGFGALMFGQLLKSHLVFAYGPQTLAWTTYSTLFNKACEMCVVPDNPHLFDIGQLQYDTDGFIPNVQISLCENNAIDQFALFNIDLTDPNLNIMEYKGDSHAMYQVIGKRKMFTEICEYIDLYIPSHEAITGSPIPV
ncbi:tetratricopeptide repeat protein [Psychrobacter sp. ASPA161_9]|uniref:tetratricopeptide repeat protein n=1 Tax=Psychrobacter sp. ASPA161_9 TaxID=3160961 RepID=UPI003F818786